MPLRVFLWDGDWDGLILRASHHTAATSPLFGSTSYSKPHTYQRTSPSHPRTRLPQRHRRSSTLPSLSGDDMPHNVSRACSAFEQNVAAHDDGDDNADDDRDADDDNHDIDDMLT